MQGADVLGDETPDINQVFTMYGPTESKRPYTSGTVSPKPIEALRKTRHSPSPFSMGSSSLDTTPSVVGKPRSTNFGLPISSSPRHVVERRQRERGRTDSVRSSSYSSLAPAPQSRRTSAGVAPVTTEIYSNDGIIQTQDLTTQECRSPNPRQTTLASQPVDPTGSPEYGLRRNPSVNSVGYHYTASYSPSLTEELFQSQALELADEGQSKTIDANRVAQWGGIEQLGMRLRNEVSGYFDGGVVEDLKGSTHVLLASLSNPLAMSSLLDVLLPIIENTLVVLDVHANMLREVPNALARCRELEELNLSENPIPAVPKWLGDLTELRVVILDRCSLRALPATMIAAQQLHTICIRHNRLISLPSWLSQLPRLETLLIEGNPFVGPWKTLSRTLTISALQTASSFPIGEQDQNGHAAPDATTLQLIDGRFELPTTQSPLAGVSALGDPLATAEGSHELQGMALGTDQLYAGDRDARAPQSLRRMQSAGALFGLRSLSASHVPIRGNTYSRTVSSQIPSRIGSTSTALDIPSSDDGDEMEMLSTREDKASSDADDVVPTATTTKSGKWGFLRKMSMNRMRTATIEPKQGTGQTEARKLTGREGRKPIKKMQSLVSIPSHDDVERSASNSRMNALKHPSYQSGKRRSFLPVLDGPPSLNVAIPSFSSSPFSMSTLSLHSLPTGDDTRDTAAGNPLGTLLAPPGSSISQSDRSNPVQSRALSSSTTNYEMGFKTIMSYLGDLYDLSLPVPTVQGGAEIVQGDLGTTSASVSISSESRSGASSPQISGNHHTSRFTPTVLKATQHSGLGFARDGSPTAPISPATSDAQGGYDIRTQSRPASVARVADEDTMPIKRYKDDPLARLGVIKHIIDTERTYVRGLQDLVEIYVKPASQLVSKGDSETVVPANERKIVFGGLEGILQFHRQSFLPALEKAAGLVSDTTSTCKETNSQDTAMHVANVFKLYHPFMRQYSSYINNFDYALMRLRTWSDKTNQGGFSGASQSLAHETVPTISAGALTAGLGIGAANGPQSSRTNATAGLTIAQKKRIRSFLKHCRKHPRHSQLNLESYLLMPVQRIPRYRMLLEDLARCTPPLHLSTGEPIEDALQEMVALASTMNEEKRDSESRRKLVKWQQRIRGRFATPLVQAHRRLLLDGQLMITRNVKRSATLVEVPGSLLVDENADRTITNAKTVVQVETLIPEIMERPVLVLLASDMMLLCKDPSQGQDPDCAVELFAVLKLQTKPNPASVINGSGIRLVDNRNILYLAASSNQEAVAWVDVINNGFDPTK